MTWLINGQTWSNYRAVHWRCANRETHVLISTLHNNCIYSLLWPVLPPSFFPKKKKKKIYGAQSTLALIINVWCRIVFFFVLSFSLSLLYIRCIFRSCVAIGFMQMFGEQKIDVENIDCGGGGISMRVGFFLFFFFFFGNWTTKYPRFRG